MAVDGATPQAAPIVPQATAKDRRSSSAGLADAPGNVLLTQACYPHAADTKKPRRVAGASIGEARGQWAQPPALDGEPSVLNDEPQAQLLTAFGLLIAKPEPMSEST